VPGYTSREALLCVGAQCSCVILPSFCRRSAIDLPLVCHLSDICDEYRRVHGIVSVFDYNYHLPMILAFAASLNTLKTYLDAFRRWRRWSLSVFRLEPVLINERRFVSYLLALLFECNSVASIRLAMLSVSFVCKLLGESDVALSAEVRGIVNFASRVLPAKRRVKSVVPPEAVRLVGQAALRPGVSLLQLRSAAMCVLGFAGFFRISDMLGLRREDVHVSSKCITVDVRRSKVDQFSVGDRVYVGATGGQSCPVNVLSAYLARTKHKPHEYLFRSLDASNSSRLSSCNRPLTYSNARDCFSRLMCSVSSSYAVHTLHGLRRGAASAAARGGVTERVIKRQGRWRSDRCKDLYVSTDCAEQSGISKLLGL